MSLEHKNNLIIFINDNNSPANNKKSYAIMIKNRALLSLHLLFIVYIGCTDNWRYQSIKSDSDIADSADTGTSWQWGTAYSFDDVLAQCLSLVSFPSETLCEQYPTTSSSDIRTQETCQDTYSSFSRNIGDLTNNYTTDTIDSLEAAIDTTTDTYFSSSEDGTEYITVPAIFYSITFIDTLGHSIKCSAIKEDFSEYGLSEAYVMTNLCYMLSGEGTLHYYDSFCRDPNTGVEATNYVSITHIPNLDAGVSDSVFSNYSNITISSGLSSSMCDDFIDDGRTTYSPYCPGFFTTEIAEHQAEYSAKLELLVEAGNPISF